MHVVFTSFFRLALTLLATDQIIDLIDPNFWQKWAKKADLYADDRKGKVSSVNVNGSIV